MVVFLKGVAAQGCYRWQRLACAQHPQTLGAGGIQSDDCKLMVPCGCGVRKCNARARHARVGAGRNSECQSGVKDVFTRCSWRDGPSHCTARTGDFSVAFSSAQVADLLTFARVQVQASPAALAKAQAQAQGEQVVAWLTKYFSAHGSVNSSSNANLMRHVEQLCRRDMGLQVHLTFLGRDCQSVFATFRIGTTDSRVLSLRCAPDLPWLKAQDIEVTYA